MSSEMARELGRLVAIAADLEPAELADVIDHAEALRGGRHFDADAAVTAIAPTPEALQRLNEAIQVGLDDAAAGRVVDARAALADLASKHGLDEAGRQVRVELTAAASRDVDGILAQLAGERPSAARRFRERLLEAFDRLEVFPHSGMPAAGIQDATLLLIPVGVYLLAYRPEAERVLVVRVFHGRRDRGNVLGTDV